MIGPEYLYHPLGQCLGTHAEIIRCHSYNFWSGIFSDLGEVTLVTGTLTLIFGAIHHLECHETGCHRRGKYLLEGGIRACDIHDPKQDKRPENSRGKVHEMHVAHHKHLKRLYNTKWLEFK